MTALAGTFALFLSVLSANPLPPQSCRADEVVFTDGQRRIPVTVEIADDPQERARGLMFRKDLPQGTGMLFIYEQPGPVSFWMRNTLIPLDMIFVDERGTVRHIHPMAIPHDETGVPGAPPGDPDPDRLMVVEVPGGDAARLGLRTGMFMAHPRLPQDSALAPCS